MCYGPNHVGGDVTSLSMYLNSVVNNKLFVLAEACAVSWPLDVAQKHGPSIDARHRGELWVDDITLQLLLT